MSSGCCVDGISCAGAAFGGTGALAGSPGLAGSAGRPRPSKPSGERSDTVRGLFRLLAGAAGAAALAGGVAWGAFTTGGGGAADRAAGSAGAGTGTDTGTDTGTGAGVATTTFAAGGRHLSATSAPPTTTTAAASRTSFLPERDATGGTAAALSPAADRPDASAAGALIAVAGVSTVSACARARPPEAVARPGRACGASASASAITD